MTFRSRITWQLWGAFKAVRLPPWTGANSVKALRTGSCSATSSPLPCLLFTHSFPTQDTVISFCTSFGRKEKEKKEEEDLFD